jgi:energy-converting hydrogenase A subunit M
MREMIEKGHVYDKDIDHPDARQVTMESEDVIEFFGNARVEWN